MVKEKCDILILSASYGGGHNQVARALTQAIQLQAPGTKILTVDYCDLLYPLINKLSQFSYTQSIKHFPVGYALYYQATGNISSDSFWQRRLNRMGYSELIMLVDRLSPKVIISTFPLPAGVLSQMKESGDLNVPVATVITDMCVHSQWIHPKTDLYIVGSSEVAQGLRERGIARESIAVTGIPILPAFTRSFDIMKTKQKFGIAPTDKVVLFMGGNEGVFGTTRFNYLLRDLPKNVQTIVVTGSNHDMYERLQASSAKTNNLKVYRYIENMAELMEAVDLLVTKPGGITVSEALAKELPMLIYKPTPGHEEANADFLVRHRVAIVAKGERRLKNAIQRMITDDQFRLRLQRNCSKIAAPNSAALSARLILDLMTPITRNRLLLFRTKVRREVRA